ncbi:amino acid ABC transporter permease [Synechococcus sp. PCC 7502]|uniref:amino acid ABC transporter permease n=1 Tax=Synechococcus sp. PCC 7502 TaxID=1173263 RepID=UPI001FEE44C0|nr:amino acid ABC transporter permease [Synechococcus sp. PCC 7502]
MGAWIFFSAQWQVVSANLPLFLVGRYPAAQYWRIWLVLGIFSTLGLLELFHELQVLQIHRIKWLWLGSAPVILWLIGGGFGLTPVNVNLWNGLLLTLLMAIAGIILSFPLGVLLALGRQSSMPIISILSTSYIEIMRGLPLIGILFMAQVLLPLCLPPEIKIDRVVRAIAGFTLFSAAYLAENVRGGLQAVSQGQMQAGKALGLSTPTILWFIVLPQALRAVTPAIAGQFIGLFKDTSLVSIVGLVDLMGIGRSILAQPDFVGSYAEVYLFIGGIYWLFCYGISLLSRLKLT